MLVHKATYHYVIYYSKWWEITQVSISRGLNYGMYTIEYYTAVNIKERISYIAMQWSQENNKYKRQVEKSV